MDDKLDGLIQAIWGSATTAAAPRDHSRPSPKKHNSVRNLEKRDGAPNSADCPLQYAMVAKHPPLRMALRSPRQKSAQTAVFGGKKFVSSAVDRDPDRNVS
ncbi:hypothetical protein [Shinella sp.]|uniref:hypothetical protein n=1 Tax=Shinella sp. TaxID=1870904 RepID=UPI003D2A111E